MICMEANRKPRPAEATFTSRLPKKDAFLSLREKPFHLLTQYSVKRTSLMGRFFGGVKLAC